MQSISTLLDLDTAIEDLKSPAGTPTLDVVELIASLSDEAELPPEVKQVDVRVAAVLRLAAVDHHALNESPHRRQLLDLVKERLNETGSSLLKKYNLADRKEAERVCSSMGRIADDAIDGLHTAIQSYHDVHSLPSLREQLLQAINDDRAKAAIRPFLISHTDPSGSLQRSLGAAVFYLDADAGEAGAALDVALTMIRDNIGQLSSLPTAASRPICSLLDQICSDLRDHFDSSSYSKPAQISLDSTLRRHPLHVPDLEISIPVALRNYGEGVAVTLEVEIIEAIGIKPVGSPLRLSNVTPGSIIIELNALTDPSAMEAMGGAACVFRVSWINPDGSEESKQIDSDLHSQDPDLDWEELNSTDPYSLEAVDTEEHLIGRSAMLKQTKKVLTTSTVGSLYIHGQKRVGKTSLALVALNGLELDHQATYIYLEIGEINNPDPARAINNLTERLISELGRKLSLPLNVPESEYDGSLAPLVKILKSLAPTHKPIVLAIDEFDRLPAPLYRRNAQADAFFTALRSIGTIRGVGVVLIGGERMKLIINGPGVELNKFKAFPVEYIDRATQWTEFEELVRKPTESFLEFTDDACAQIYELTAGNPFYTKQLCDRVLELATHRRDAYIDVREVDAATRLLVGTVDSASFSHYWEDHLLEYDEKRDQITLNRRRCLLALGLAWASGEPATTDAVALHAIQVGLDYTALQRELRLFRDREILLEVNGAWEPRVNLFRRWMVERGQRQIVISAAELEAAEHVIAQQSAMRVTISEADELGRSFGTYKGKSISGERILEYVKQFGDLRDQRLIFRLLGSLQVVSQADVDQSLRDAYEVLAQVLKDRHGEWKQEQILLTHTGRLEKSGVTMSRAFIKANVSRLALKAIHNPSDLPDLLADGITDVVMIDDFVGSGDSLTYALEGIHEYIPASVALHIFLLAGMEEGVDRVRKTVVDLFGSSSSVHCMTEIPSSPGPFDPEASVYNTEEDARDALALILKFGQRLEPRIPMGYGDCCSLVVFSSSIPNNAPAILWSRSTGTFKFEPLFPRNV